RDPERQHAERHRRARPGHAALRHGTSRNRNLYSATEPNRSGMIIPGPASGWIRRAARRLPAGVPRRVTADRAGRRVGDEPGRLDDREGLPLPRQRPGGRQPAASRAVASLTVARSAYLAWRSARLAWWMAGVRSPQASPTTIGRNPC